MRKTIRRLFRSNALFTIGIIICMLWILAAIFAPWIAPYDPIEQDLTVRLKAPSGDHWFGTDQFGQDIFSRVIYGGRYSLLAGLLTVVIAGAIGTMYGAVAGYIGGSVDAVMMRISEMIMSFPSLILAMIINSVMGSNLFNTMFALVIVAWPNYARLMRSVVLSVKESEYVTAARSLGSGNLRVLMKELTAELARLEGKVGAEEPRQQPAEGVLPYYAMRQFVIVRNDLQNAGKAANEIKRMMAEAGVEKKVIRRVAVAAYELEINICIHSLGGTLTFILDTEKATLIAKDRGPGIENVEWACRDGTSTANDWIRSMGFGAGMGLANSKRVSDSFDIQSKVPTGTTVMCTFRIGGQ